MLTRGGRGKDDVGCHGQQEGRDGVLREGTLRADERESVEGPCTSVQLYVTYVDKEICLGICCVAQYCHVRELGMC